MPATSPIKIAAQKFEGTEIIPEWRETASQPEIVAIFKTKIMPAPKAANWLQFYGSWEGFCKAMHKSIGRKIGSGVLTFSEDWPQTAKKASR